MIPHPDFPHPAGIAISVEAERDKGALSLIYSLAGDEEDELIRYPTPGTGKRTDGLWKHTCFESFIRIDGQPGYCELNFSPWGEWAAYAFDGQREGMRDLIGVSEPFAQLQYKGDTGDGVYRWLCSTIDAFDASVDWHLGLTAVIEAKDGTRSYWALAHAPGPPDFHNPACFVATLPAPDGP